MIDLDAFAAIAAHFRELEASSTSEAHRMTEAFGDRKEGAFSRGQASAFRIAAERLEAEVQFRKECAS